MEIIVNKVLTVMVADVINQLKKIQIELFLKELNNLEKGKPYTNDSFNLSLIIDSADCSSLSLLNMYLSYFKSKCYERML